MGGHTRRAVAGLALLLVLGCNPRASEPTAPPSGSQPPPSIAATSAPTDAPEPSPTTDTATWEVLTVAPMLRPRDGFRALPLGDDTVLAVGDDGACHPGPAEPGSVTSERYDPVADEWTIAASLNKPREDFAMVPDQAGGVIVIGGVDASGQPFSSTKVFDLETAMWTDGPLLGVAYGDVSAATLTDGRIVVAGPTIQRETSPTSTVVILGPGRDAWEDGGRIGGLRIHALTLIGDGALIGLGAGFELPDTLVVLDTTGAFRWQPFGAPDFGFIEGVVPFAGGMLAFGTVYDESTGDTLPAQPRRWDPIAGAWVETGLMAAPRAGAAIATLNDGRVLVAGGVVGPQDFNEGEVVSSTEVYDPASGTWSAGPDLLGPRDGGQAIVLDDGSVLLMGGVNVRNVGGDTPFCPGTLTSVERIVSTPWSAPEV